MNELNIGDILFSLLAVGAIYGFAFLVGRLSRYRHYERIRKELEDDADAASSYRGADGHE